MAATPGSGMARRRRPRPPRHSASPRTRPSTRYSSSTSNASPTPARTARPPTTRADHGSPYRPGTGAGWRPRPARTPTPPPTPARFRQRRWRRHCQPEPPAVTNHKPTPSASHPAAPCHRCQAAASVPRTPRSPLLALFTSLGIDYACRRSPAQIPHQPPPQPPCPTNNHREAPPAARRALAAFPGPGATHSQGARPSKPRGFPQPCAPGLHPSGARARPRPNPGHGPRAFLRLRPPFHPTFPCSGYRLRPRQQRRHDAFSRSNPLLDARQPVDPLRAAVARWTLAHNHQPHPVLS